MKQQDRQKYRL